MISATITAKNEQLVIAGLKALDEVVLQAAETGLARGLLLVVASSQREYLSGPRPNKIQSVTGRLRQSVTSNVTRSADRVVGRVGSSVKYAAFHEFGFHGVQNVRAHSRVMDQTFGGYEDSVRGTRKQAVSDKGEVLGFTESRKRAARRQRGGFVSVQFVRAHSRRVNYAGKPFVRPALEQLTPQISTEITKELNATKNK
jgi:phage gpG-like protein